MKPTHPTGGPQRLSEEAKILLRHFRDQKIPQLAYEYPSEMAKLYSDPQKCEMAQAELHALGLIELGPELPKHIPASSRIRHAAVTLEGERAIEAGECE